MSIQVPGTGPNPQLEGLNDFWAGVSASFLVDSQHCKQLTTILPVSRKAGHALDLALITIPESVEEESSLSSSCLQEESAVSI